MNTRSKKWLPTATALALLMMLWKAPLAHATGVYISAPANGDVVSGVTNIVLTIDSNVVWTNVYVDSKFFLSAPPYVIPWNTVSVGNGLHTIKAVAYAKSGTQLGSASVSVNVNNTTATIPGATSYYVASGGKDSNPGTSPTSAWATLARVNSANLQPGDTVYFQAGLMWRGTLTPPRGGIPGAPITFTSFGTGNKPVISGADVVTGWTLESGSIYRASLATAPGNVFVDGGPMWGLKQASSVSAMVAGTWYWDSGLARLYVWLYDSSAASAHSIEAATRAYGSYVNSGICNDFSYITINGLTFQRTKGFGVYFHCFSGPTPMTGIVIQNNTVRQTGTGQVDGGQYYNGIMFLDEPAYSDAAPQILGNTVSYTGGHGNGINLQGANNALISGNDVSNWNHNGIDVKDATGVIVDSNVVHDLPAAGAAYYVQYGAVTYQRNVAYNAHTGFQIGNSAQANVYNNSIYNCPTGVYLGPAGTSVDVKNNAVKGSYYAFGTDGNTNFAEDYNDWGVTPKFSVTPNIYTFSQWQSMGTHNHDIAVDPLWQAPPSNLNLTQSSLCVDSGTDVGLPYSGTAPDLGAKESGW